MTARASNRHPSEGHASLTAFVADLRQRMTVNVPDFDPLGGGQDLTILFLFEKPGPMTDASRNRKPGSGFISINNDDPTAEASFHFMKAAAIPRRDTVLWNVIPWWDGQIAFTSADRHLAMQELDRLLGTLTRLHTVVLVKRTAAKARAHFRDLRVIESPHPSPKVRATDRARWDSIPGIWRTAVLEPEQPHD
jgi:hypothetical protein